MSDLSNVDIARENEQVADYLDEGTGSHRNWIVTINFYSVLHYVEQVLQDEGFSSVDHDDREDNILRCQRLEDEQFTIYKNLRTLSSLSRYECYRMGQEELEVAERALERTKEITAFDMGGGSSKYDIS